MQAFLLQQVLTGGESEGKHGGGGSGGEGA